MDYVRRVYEQRPNSAGFPESLNEGEQTPAAELTRKSCLRPVARVVLSTVIGRRECASLAAAWTLLQRTLRARLRELGVQQLTSVQLPDCRSCGEITAVWCDSCDGVICTVCERIGCKLCGHRAEKAETGEQNFWLEDELRDEEGVPHHGENDWGVARPEDIRDRRKH